MNNFSQKQTLLLIDQVIAASQQDLIGMRDSIVKMHETCPSKREKRSVACTDVPGCTFALDNVGKYYFLLLNEK